MKAKVEIFLKPGVLDVQGKATESALHGLGFPFASHVRIGKTIVLELQEDDPEEAEKDIRAMCNKLLVNAVIETFEAHLVWNGPKGPLTYSFGANSIGILKQEAA